MRVLVTGATGFIGNHVIAELLRSGSHQIIATSRDIGKARKTEWFNDVEYVPYSIDGGDAGNLYKLFGEPDKVVHLAWDGLPNYRDLMHVEKNLFNHCGFLKNLLENGLREVIVTGTCFEYGMQNGCLSEGACSNPSNAYSIAKDTLRRYIVELNKGLNFSYKWVRLFYMYGEGQSSGSLMAQLEEAIRAGDSEFNMSGGEQLRDFSPVSEIAESMVLIALQDLYRNQIINCCSGRPISVRKLVEGYLRGRGYDMKLNLGFYPYPDFEPMAFWGDGEKLERIRGNADQFN